MPCEFGALSELRILQLHGQTPGLTGALSFTSSLMFSVPRCYVLRCPDANRVNVACTALTPCLGNLTRLRALTAGTNQLATLPDEILQLKRLEFLHLAQNRIARGMLDLTKLPMCVAYRYLLLLALS